LIRRNQIRARTEAGPDNKSRRVGYIIVCNDVSDLKEAEHALKESVVERTRLLASETAAKEASRVKSAWLANTTHEIRTPISAMVGLAELLLDDKRLSAEHRDHVEKIVRSCEILLDMVGMVLDMGKVEAGKLVRRLSLRSYTA
jgi:signal transduction histidine kinase